MTGVFWDEDSGTGLTWGEGSATESGGAKDQRLEAHGPESETGPRQTEHSCGRVNQLRVAARKA